MTDKIILNIVHSDDYTDYLLMTAGLTNRRIIPLVDPDDAELRARKDANTKVLRCYNTRKEMHEWDSPVSSDPNTGAVRILSRFYLDDDGTVNAANAEIVRLSVQQIAMNVLQREQNLREVFRHYFPLLWSKRERIYASPRLFFAESGRNGGLVHDDMPVGAVLKAIEEDPKTFRIRLGGGCSCGERPFLIDYDRVYGEHWTLHTWCPVCRSRREIRAWNFQRAWNCDQSIETSRNYYDKGQGLSGLSLFDVIDALG